MLVTYGTTCYTSVLATSCMPAYAPAPLPPHHLAITDLHLTPGADWRTYCYDGQHLVTDYTTFAGSNYYTMACVDCPAGTWSMDGIECSYCAEGFIAPSTKMKQCTPCSSGAYSSDNSTACIPCAAGTYQPAVAGAGGVTGCLTCPAGRAC